MRYALDRDVVVVAAAGNENQTAPGATWFPAAYPGVLAVASVDADGQPTEESNCGPWVGIADPGKELTTLATGGGGYAVVTGTSFATAVVAATAALVRSRFPGLKAPAVVQRLQGTAVSLTGGRDEITGAGIVDPFEALTAVGVAAPTTAAPPAAGEAVRVLPVPVEEPLLTPTGAVALAATAILLVAAGVAAATGMTRRRSALRRGVAGPDPLYADAHRPLEPVPDRRLD